MTGHHAGPRKDRTRFFRARGTAPLAAPAGSAPPTGGSGHIPFEAVPGPSLPRRVADSGAVAAGLRARRDLTRQRDIPTAVLPALRAWAAAPPAPRPRCGEVSAIWVGQIAYPQSGVLDPRQYAATLRHIGLATGTTTRYEADSVWRLALDPGTGATA